jgi:hypothetical protein
MLRRSFLALSASVAALLAVPAVRVASASFPFRRDRTWLAGKPGGCASHRAGGGLRSRMAQGYHAADFRERSLTG